MIIGLLVGVGIGVVLFALTGGHVLFLPLFLVLPLGGFLAGRRRN